MASLWTTDASRARVGGLLSSPFREVKGVKPLVTPKGQERAELLHSGATLVKLCLDKSERAERAKPPRVRTRIHASAREHSGSPLHDVRACNLPCR